LRPITDTRPKPMVEFHGRPFLEYLIELLREQGFEHVLLLLGHLPDVVRHHFGDGRDFGVRIDYTVSSADDLTVSRIRLAEPLLDDCFLLMYCDNYWPLRFERMWERFAPSEAAAMVTVYANRDGYRPGKDSVRVDDEGKVRVFDRSRRTPGLEGVEISYAIVRRAALDVLPAGDALIEEALYPPLAAEGRLLAHVSEHRYYSVGSLERLPVTERFLARHPTAILDRDGVLNRRPPRAQYVRTPEEFEWLPGARDALCSLTRHGYRTIVVSNQAGIGRGAMSEQDLERVHERMLAEAEEAGGAIDAIYHCPHDWDEGCDCRKPAPGMLFQAQRDFDLDLTRVPFIGDDERDAQAADAAGCPSLMVSEEVPLVEVVNDLVAGSTERAVA
jgi:histidinol-phosphate phosphatase family protein